LPKSLPFIVSQRLADFLGYRVERASNFFSIIELLEKLRPVETDFPLVRVGGESDGGYLLPDCFENCEGVISPGVGPSALFESYFSTLGIPSILIDGTVKEPPDHATGFTFVSKMLASTSSAPGTITLQEACDLLGESSKNLILQMDIEGAEWLVLESTPDQLLKRFKLLVIEFHSFDQLVGRASSFRIVEDIFNRLLDNFSPVHVHVNNCSSARKTRPKGLAGFTRSENLPNVFEITLLRKDLVPPESHYSQIPNDLDTKNCQALPDIPLPSVWVNP
jgi:hypothetical protein